MKATAPAQDLPSATMTIRVYHVDRYGTVSADRGTVSVLPSSAPVPTTTKYPPCECLRCHVGRAVHL